MTNDEQKTLHETLLSKHSPETIRLVVLRSMVVDALPHAGLRELFSEMVAVQMKILGIDETHMQRAHSALLQTSETVSYLESCS